MRYNTNQRERILEYLKNNKDKHCTADIIVGYFAGTTEPIGKATVYRYLDVLVNDNVIRKYVIEEGKSACYQYVSQGDDCHLHYHFKCTECGELLHISCDLMNGVKNHVLEDHGFTIDTCKTVFYGICGKCKQKER